MFDHECLKHPVIFEFRPSRKKTLGILSIPHPGEEIPTDFAPYLTDDCSILMKDVDYRAFDLVDMDALQDSGVCVIVSKIHRCCVDLNRAPSISVLNWKKNSHGQKVVIQEPSAQDLQALKEKYYDPYYAALSYLLEELSATTGNLVPFIDLHSMPSIATDYHLQLNPGQPKDRPDFCISDLVGKTCTKEYMDFVINFLEGAGYQALRNEPYLGGHVTKFVDKFKTNNIQIETKRSLYMDEEARELLTDKSAKIRSVLTDLVIKTIVKFC